MPFSTMWQYLSKNEIKNLIQCNPGSYDSAFDAASAGVTYGPGGTSTGLGSLGASDIPLQSPFNPANMDLTLGGDDFDPLAFEFAFNAEKYKALADTCCSTLLVTGTAEVNGLYFKNSSVINGRVTYENRDRDKVISHDKESFIIFSTNSPEIEIKSDQNDGYNICPEEVQMWTEASETGYIENRYIEARCYYPKPGFEIHSPNH